MIIFFRSVTSHALAPPPPPVTNCHTFSNPLPLERDVLYGQPLRVPGARALPVIANISLSEISHILEVNRHPQAIFQRGALHSHQCRYRGSSLLYLHRPAIVKPSVYVCVKIGGGSKRRTVSQRTPIERK